MGEHNAVEHLVIGDFLCACLDHRDEVGGGSNGDSHAADLALSLGGVDDILAVDKADAHAGDRAVPRNLGDGQRDGNAEHSGDFGLAVGIDRHNGSHDADIISHVLGEQGANGSVDNSRRKSSLLARSALAALERAGNLAYGIELLFKINRKREEIHALSRLCSHGCGAEHVGLAVTDEARTACELSHLADFNNEGSAGDFSFKLFEILEHSFTSLYLFPQTPGLSNKSVPRLPGAPIHC